MTGNDDLTPHRQPVSIRIMSVLHIQSIDDPFNTPRLARLAVSTLGRAEAMGLLPKGTTIDRLDLATVRRVVGRIAQVGLGSGFLADLTASRSRDPQRLSATLEKLNEVLDESPTPTTEWPGLVNILGVDLVARLVGISPVSARRYQSGVRSTPDAIAARLHFLALVVGDLAGAYNDIGIRRWFERKRTLLGNRAPVQVLVKEWSPDNSGPLHVRQLAQSLLSSPAT